MKRSTFEIMPGDSNQIVFFGNGLADYCDWAELLSNPQIVNRGIGGDDICGMLKRIGQIAEKHPNMLFIMLDPQNLNPKMPTDSIANCYENIIDTLLLNSPTTRVFCTSVLPVNAQIIQVEILEDLNNKIRAVANHKQLPFINLTEAICDKESALKTEYTFNGIYLNGHGFSKIAEILNIYIQDYSAN